MSHIAKHQKVLHQPKSQSSGTTTRNKTKLTLLDVADILEEDNLPNPTVWIEPPAPINGWDTDEDDAQCDNGGLLDNLPRNVLVAGSSVKLAINVLLIFAKSVKQHFALIHVLRYSIQINKLLFLLSINKS